MSVFNCLKNSVFLGLASIAIAHSLFANPETPTVIEGDVAFSNPDAATLVVTSSSSLVIIDWDSFSNDVSESIYFNLPDENSFILNRVTGNSNSDLLGTIYSNGEVGLINENGILLGSSGAILCYAFLGSTLDASNDEFILGEDINFSGTSNESIDLYGSFVNNGGDTILLGYKIYDEGFITAVGATVALGAGQEIVLHPTGSERISVISQGIQESPSGNGIEFVENSTILSRQLEMKADGGFFELGIKHEGWIDTRGVSDQNGYVIFSSENGTTYLNGFLTNRNTDTTAGGDVDVFGQTVILDDSCYLDVSGLIGGGQINIGGKFQGNGAPFNSLNTQLTFASYITADAGIHNDGGQIVVWSDDVTGFYGSISSRAGYSDGDGGLVEISGVNYLDFSGSVDNTSSHGSDGLLLLDPNVLIYHPRKFK